MRYALLACTAGQSFGFYVESLLHRSQEGLLFKTILQHCRQRKRKGSGGACSEPLGPSDGAWTTAQRGGKSFFISKDEKVEHASAQGNEA